MFDEDKAVTHGISLHFCWNRTLRSTRASTSAPASGVAAGACWHESWVCGTTATPKAAASEATAPEGTVSAPETTWCKTRAAEVAASVATHAAGVRPVRGGTALNCIQRLLDQRGIDSRDAHEPDRLLVVGGRGVHLGNQCLDFLVHRRRTGDDQAIGVVVVGHGQGDALGIAIEVDVEGRGAGVAEERAGQA